jgi:hypothetical protein
MRKTTITWQEQDKSSLKMNPMELLQHSTKLSANRPEDEPWVAVVKPNALEHDNYVLSLSLDAYHMYSEGVREEFANECETLLAMCELEEIEEIRSEEIRKGNLGELYQVDEGLLRLHIPSRLLSRAKTVIESIFRRMPGNVVDEKSVD